MAKLFAELTSTCNALGYSAGNGSKYYLDKECKEAVRDLIRFLRRDDEDHQIRRHLGASKIVQTDLLLILIHHHQDSELFDLLLRLLVNLTTPTLLLYNDELPAEKVSRQYYLSIIEYLQEYKQAFANAKIWTILAEKLTELLNLDWSERGEEKGLMIVRILILVRNVLHVPINVDTEKRPDNDASVHDQVLWALHEGGILNLILYVANSDDERQHYLHALEIVSLMLRDQSAEVLAKSSAQRSVTEKERDESELVATREHEMKEKMNKMRTHIAARHSRFGGTFVVKGVKSISDNDMIVHSLKDISTLSLDKHKRKVKTAKNRLPMRDEGAEHRSSFSVRIFLREFCVEFLNGSYNKLMKCVKEMISGGKAEANDESYYFWAIKFFLEFNRNYAFQVKLISETMSVGIFHFIQERIEEWKEKLIIDKKKVSLWSKRLHLAVKAYYELLKTLMVMFQSDETAIKQSAESITSNIFYISEYREVLASLLGIFDEIKFSREYLKDLIEANHIFIKMLERSCKNNQTLIVQKKAKIVRRKKKKSQNHRKNSKPAENPEELWSKLENRAAEIFNNKESIAISSIIPFDAASEVPIEDQKIEAMKKIKYLLTFSKVEEAISLLYASREVWSENDCFGSNDMTVEEELTAVSEIFFSNIDKPRDTNFVNGLNTEINENSEEDELSDEENEAEQYQTNVAVAEQTFELFDFIKKFAKPKIVQACCLLLSQFEKNTEFTNHCILKLLHRIAFDCKFHAILFQASVFRTFQRILSSKNPRHKELQKFAIYIIKRFTKVAETNKKVYMELLFWKGSKEAYEIEEGYGSTSVASLEGKGGKMSWTETEEDEVRTLYAEFERDKPQCDMVDWIHARLIDKNRSRRSLIKKMKELGLIIGKYTGGRKGVNTRLPKEFSEEEVAEIMQLLEEFKEAQDPMSRIMERLTVKRPKKRIVDKILQLGLVQDRKQLRKKRVKSGPRKSTNENGFSHSESEESANDSESDNDDDSSSSEDEIFGCGPRDRANAGSVKCASLILSHKDVKDNLLRVEQSGMKESVEWFTSCMEEMMEDMDIDETDVPILPLTDYTVKAMDNHLFQAFLTSIGVKKPSSHEEVYWRMPGTWTANDIRSRIELIKKILEEPSPSNISPSNESSLEPRRDDDTAQHDEDQTVSVDDSFLNQYVEENIDRNDEDQTNEVDQSFSNEYVRENIGRQNGLEDRTTDVDDSFLSKYVRENIDQNSDLDFEKSRMNEISNGNYSHNDCDSSDSEDNIIVRKKRKVSHHSDSDDDGSDILVNEVAPSSNVCPVKRKKIISNMDDSDDE